MSCDEYRVRLSAAAEGDLDDIVGYIANVLRSSKAAENTYQIIKQRISSLNRSPARCALVRFEPHRSKAIRWTMAGNYMIFFIIDDSADQVMVLRILYGKRQWEQLL